jgi:citrate synthase
VVILYVCFHAIILWLLPCRCVRGTTLRFGRDSAVVHLLSVGKGLFGNRATRSARITRLILTVFGVVSQSLRRRLEELVPAMQENMKELNSKHGDVVLGNVTVSKAIGGARGVPCLVWETSLLDELKGISFRGLSIPEIQKKMPTVVPGGEPTPEGMLWLLLTGEIPTKKEMESVQEELHGRSQLPSGVKRVINSLRKDMHPMTQLSIAVMAMQADSKFAKAYQVRVCV